MDIILQLNLYQAMKTILNSSVVDVSNDHGVSVVSSPLTQVGYQGQGSAGQVILFLGNDGSVESSATSASAIRPLV